MMLQEVVREQAELAERRAKLIAEHQGAVAVIDARLKELATLRALAADGVDVDRAALGRGLVMVYGECMTDSRRWAVRDAMRDLAVDPDRIKREFRGVKIYASFGEQRSDHLYGYGPSHGSIVFSVGLTDGARQRDLTPEEIESALYFLEQVLAGKWDAAKKAD